MKNFLSKLGMFVLYAFVAIGVYAACNNTKKENKPQPKITVEQCYKAWVFIIDEDEDFDEQVEFAKEHMKPTCHCIIKIGDNYDGVTITMYDIQRGGYDLPDYGGGTGRTEHIDNIVQVLTGEDLPKGMCE